MSIRRRQLTRLALFSLASALAQGPLSALAQTTTGHPDKVVLAGWSKPITEITHLLAEPDKGFFAKQGIELVYLPGAGGGDAVRNLLSGQADIAFTDPGSLFAALDKGEKLRIIYDVYPQNVFNVVALQGSQIRTPADLKGKRVGVYSLSSGTRQNLQLLLHTAGLSESDITVVPTGLLNFGPLMQGQVDATAATDTGLLIGRQRGLGPVQVMEVRQHLNLSSDVLVVREATYQQHKALLARFVAAFRDSVRWMEQSPDDAARIATVRAIDGQNEALNREIIRLRLASSQSALTQAKGLGSVDTQRLREGMQAYRALGVLQRDIPLEQILGTDVLNLKP